jgi:hypothetical protein
MVVIHQHNSALLSRVLSLKDHSPFILIVDTVAQSCDYLLRELFHRVPKVDYPAALLLRTNVERQCDIFIL